MPVDEIMKVIRADEFADVTFSGGDPMFQPEGFTKLARKIKKETGKNIIYYINETKMKEALPLLDKSELSIHEIAARVGVEDPFYFNRLFRRFYGMAPREYRKKIRGEKE